MEQQGLVFRLRLVRRLIRLIRAGVLSSEIAGSWPLDQVHEAVAAAEDSGTAGKCLLRLDTT
jgi:NADPH:quinone reductase-like Zn-dependent oxidoreductase